MAVITTNPLMGYYRSRDGQADSLAISVTVGVCDPTGGLRAGLNRLDGTLRGIGLDPTIMFGVVHDDSSPVPFDATDFARQATIGHDLSEGGAARCHEVAAYHLLRHTSIDCYEKRGQKGLAVFIAETPGNDEVDPVIVRSVIGDQFGFGIPTADVFAELADRYTILAVLPTGGTSDVGRFWSGLDATIALTATAATAADTIATWAVTQLAH